MRTSRVRYPIPPHSIIPGAGPLWWCMTQISILSPRCLLTRIRPSWSCRQMRDSSVKTTSYHSATHILLSSHHWRQRRLWFCVKGRPSNGRLADRPLCCKWYAQTLNDALQTQCSVSLFVMRLSDPSQSCAQFVFSHVKWCPEVDAIDHVGPSYPPASNGHISVLQLFGFVQHDYRFP
ncbi:hypothetical protein TNCV_1727041 [Trichonephila clavipes]|nr:hypothetical protein TNCV_1727041 [Trichonephila clavipes]